MEYKRIFKTNGAIKPVIEEAKEMGYKYIIKAKDKFLSGWGNSEHKTHVQIILCRTSKELNLILRDLESDKTFNYITWNYLEYNNLYNYI